MSGDILSGVFKGTYILENFHFWMILFFVSISVLSFKDVISNKFVYIFCGIIRFICILFFILGPIIIIFKKGRSYPLTFEYTYDDNTTVDYKIFNFDKFSNLFSNLVFAFTVLNIYIVLTFYA